MHTLKKAPEELLKGDLEKALPGVFGPGDGAIATAYVRGDTERQIADQVGLTPGRIHQRLARIRERLGAKGLNAIPLVRARGRVLPFSSCKTTELAEAADAMGEFILLQEPVTYGQRIRGALAEMEIQAGVLGWSQDDE